MVRRNVAHVNIFLKNIFRIANPKQFPGPLAGNTAGRCTGQLLRPDLL